MDDSTTRMDEQPTPVRAIVTDDDPLARSVVKEALRAAGITVVAEASSGREAVELAAHYAPDVVLMDLLMPGVDGIEATRRIHRLRPHVKVIVLTASDDGELGLLALRAGAVGFLGKSVDPETLPRIVKAVAAGEAAVPRRLTALLVERFQQARVDSSGMRPVKSVLTDREWEVLDLLCRGETTEGIAAELVLSVETVRSHVKSLLRKLGVSSRQEAVSAAMRLRGDAPDLVEAA